RVLFFFFSSRRRHTRFSRDWSSDVCSSDLGQALVQLRAPEDQRGRVVGVYSMIGSGMRTGNGISLAWLGALLGVSGAVAVGGIRSEERRVGKARESRKHADWCMMR